MLLKKGKEKTTVDTTELKFFCDNKRHLVCLPFSIENLHKMAKVLKINSFWFHKGKDKPHYDIPKKRIKEITDKCQLISPKQILQIVKGEITEL